MRKQDQESESENTRDLQTTKKKCPRGAEKKERRGEQDILRRKKGTSEVGGAKEDRPTP